MNHDNLTDPKPDEPLGRLIAERLAARQAIVDEAVAEGEMLLKVRIPVQAAKQLKNNWNYLWLSVLILAVGIVGIKTIRNDQTTTPETRTYSTTKAQRATITLVDGSTAILAPATKIHVTNRQVELDGEAIFTVTSRASQAFTVKTGNAVIKVLGTTFGVRKYGDEPVRVAMIDGKVSVASTVLSAGDIAIVRSDKIDVRHDMDVTGMLAWTSGRLEFRRASLSQVTADISRWYDVDVNIASGVSSDSEITGAFTNTNLDAVLLTISESLGVRYKVAGRTVTIFP